MKILLVKILNSQIKTIEGRAAVEVNEKKANLITFRSALVCCCGAFQPQAQPGLSAKAGQEAILAYDIGLKIHNAEKDIKLEEVDINLLQKIVDSNRVYVAFITAQLLKTLQNLTSEAAAK